ncbi:hypothetical protein BZG36_01831 [Bifiguratus adelaidae]|uniref:Alpha/beta hydrolase fold-3 domain-containing protein n=1 Tax=Bifiguratus adelaidae TaxID=1938954 RepID=A0A261Y2A3_9FUNG|nr:hypothetical protein BZG36_01831 [Bifiguratus adelaidae]
MLAASDYDKVNEEWEAFRKGTTFGPEICDIEQQRYAVAMFPSFKPSIEYPNVAIREETIPVTEPKGEIKVRIYAPTDVQGPYPLVMLYHGGGWIAGDLETEDAVCKNISSQAHAMVINVGYRLAPVYKYPVPVNDSWDALTWAIQNASILNIDTSKVAVTGSSAGGYMALVMAAKDIDEDTHYISSSLPFNR